MGTIAIIFYTVTFLFNACCVSLMFIMVSKWHRHMLHKLDTIQEYTRRVSDRDDVIYMNQLQWLKAKLVEEERYEEAEVIRKCIQIEFQKMKEKHNEQESK